MTSTALITLSVPRARVHRERTPMQPDLPLIPLYSPPPVIALLPPVRVIDGRGREERDGPKLGRCVFIAAISPLFTVPAAFRRWPVLFLANPSRLTRPSPRARSYYSHGMTRVLFIRFLSFVRSQIRCFLASRFVPPFTISRLFLLSLFYSTFAFAGGQLMPFEKYSAPFAIHQQGRVLFSNPRRVFGIPFPIAALLTDLFS